VSNNNYVDHKTNCNRCGTVMVSGWTLTCPACLTNEKLQQQNRILSQQAEQQSTQMAMQAEANAEMQKRQHYESLQLAQENAKLARKQAQENAILAAEGGVSYEDAYQCGLHYFETTTIGKKSKVDIDLTEEGDFYVFVLRDYPYRMIHLNQAFRRGLEYSIKDVQGPGSEYMESCAYNAGFSLESEFTISSNVAIRGYTPSLAVPRTSDLTRELDIDTGLITYKWNHPFKSEKLNQAYADGVNQKVSLLDENSEGRVEVRMKTEVADILAERARVAEKQRVAEVLEAQAKADALKKMSRRGYIVIGILLAIVGLIVGLWVTDHGVLSFITVIVMMIGGFRLLIDFYDSDL
jgi:hypothetical protein